MVELVKTRVAALADVAEFIRGITFKPGDVEECPTDTNVDCLRTKNVQASLDTRDVWAIDPSLVKRRNQYVAEGDILISSANSWNLVGKCCWIPRLARPTTFGGFVTVLRRRDDSVDSRYLFHWFSSDRVQRTIRSFGNQTTNISNLDLKRSASLTLPLPPLDEQRRIAAILDRADDLCTKRRRALAELDVLTQSIFHSMFGDPSASARWPEFALDDLLSAIESGQSPVCENRPAEAEEWGVLKLSAVTKLTFDGTQNKALTSVAPNKQHEVRQGDLLFSRKNTRALVAAVALVREVRPRLLLPDLIFRLRIRNHGVMTPDYLYAVMAEPTKRAQIQSLAGGSSGSMPNISKAKLLTVKIPTPPIELQQKFGRRVSAIERLKGRQRSQLAELEVLSASLQNRAFSGEL